MLQDLTEVERLVHEGIAYERSAHGNTEKASRIDIGSFLESLVFDAVLQPVFRLEQSRNCSTGGTGAGLPIAQQLARAIGGSLRLRNNASGGLSPKSPSAEHSIGHERLQPDAPVLFRNDSLCQRSMRAVCWRALWAECLNEHLLSGPVAARRVRGSIITLSAHTRA
jgi:hypothetical protein